MSKILRIALIAIFVFQSVILGIFSAIPAKADIGEPRLVLGFIEPVGTSQETQAILNVSLEEASLISTVEAKLIIYPFIVNWPADIEVLLPDGKKQTIQDCSWEDLGGVVRHCVLPLGSLGIFDRSHRSVRIPITTRILGPAGGGWGITAHAWAKPWGFPTVVAQERAYIFYADFPWNRAR